MSIERLSGIIPFPSHVGASFIHLSICLSNPISGSQIDHTSTSIEIKVDKCRASNFDVSINESHS
jgi:hypothetical protein